MSGSGALKGFAPIGFGVHGLITAIRWNACLRGACPCRCARMHADAVQGRAQEAQKAPPPSRTAARGSRRPGGRSSVVDRRITRQELKEALATRTDAIMAVMLLLTYVQFQVRAAAAAGRQPAAALLLTVLADPSPPVLLASPQSLSKVWFRNLKRPVGTRHYT